MSLESHDPRRLLPPDMEDRLIGWMIRVAGLMALIGVAAAWASLLTWSQSDPSLTHAAHGDPTNALGAAGAIFADVLLNTLGFAGVFLLLAPMFWGIELMLAERISASRKKTSLFPLAVLLLAGGFAALPLSATWPFGHSFGGIVGDWVYKLTATALDLVGASAAMPLAGFIYFLAGFAVLGYSIGLEREDLNRLLDRSRRVSRSRGPLMPEWLGQYFARSPVVFEPATAAPMQPVYATDNETPIARRREPFLPGPAKFERAMPDDADAEVMHPTQPPRSLTDAIASNAVRDHDDIGFDDTTDAESRAIAQRFAPANAPRVAAEPDDVEDLPAIVTKQREQVAKTAKRSGLLGGVATRAPASYRPPAMNLLRRPPAGKQGPTFTQSVLRGTARLLEEVLADFSIKGEVREIKPGPVVTLFELEPARGTKSSRVVALAEDIARSLSVTSARAAVVPGRNVIGIELPNVRRETVYLRDIFEADTFSASEAALPMALGKSIGGDPIVADLARMPHLLVAGTTGSGKSVGVNAMILSLLYKRAPEDCRMLMIDPKMLELSVYNGIPHLLTPVVTDPHKAVAALNWVVGEMEERYKRMAALSVRNIEAFNTRVKKAQSRGEQLTRTVQTGFNESTGEAIYAQQEVAAETMPYIVVVVDEFADLMIVAGKEIEAAIQRLAQMARAAGIHLIMATQRPSVDIVTGTIKANFPARISFKVASKIDSRTILNEQGAEQLLGQGDMLYSLGTGQIVRAHGPFVSDEEVESVVEALRKQGTPQYVDGITDTAPAADEAGSDPRTASEDDIYDMAVAIVLRDRKASTSYIQRRLSIGYNRAADLIERMESEGLISAASSTGKREILVSGRDGSGGRG
ncbi:FtsK/SpoIIIE family DNA translocase [Hyphomicrobium sulfonivorans]|nr:DNA translocase FtsK [Hyphomicrobium sulfonivorans]